MIDAVASSDGYPNSPPPFAMDVISGHRHTGKNHYPAPGSVAIGSKMKIAKLMMEHLLSKCQTISIDGKAATNVLQAVILCSWKRYTLTLLDADLVNMCRVNMNNELQHSVYYSLQHENGMIDHNAMIIYDHKSKNVCFVTTSYQLVSAHVFCFVYIYSTYSLF